MWGDGLGAACIGPQNDKARTRGPCDRGRTNVSQCETASSLREKPRAALRSLR